MTERDEQYEQRLRKTNELRELGIDPYANDFAVDTTVAAFVKRYGSEQSAAALDAVTEKHAVAGRVVAVNLMGKAAFLRIQDGTTDDLGPNNEPVGKLQIYLKKDRVGEKAFELLKHMDIGDFIGVVGAPMRTKTGELSIAADQFRILTKTLRPLPEKWHGVTDTEIRYRQRYLDLVSNAETRRIFRTRSRLVHWIRDYFVKNDFLEVETPMMHPIAGGAAARPFKTHHNTLDVDLYLRIAPELYLKRLVVGGLERVFEINRNFRNEGISTFHNPEFTMLESYEAYSDYQKLMRFIEELLSGAAQAVLGTTNIRFGEHEISMAAPFERLSMLEAIHKHGGPSPEDSRDEDKSTAILKKLGLWQKGMTGGARVVALFEHFAEPKLIQPTFVYDFPLDVSPLARKKPSNPWFVDRFELFVAGREFANGFSELNDPLDQKARFEGQLAQREAGDQEAHQMDEDYVRALEHGMPPTGGFGLGIDRLVMLFTNALSIREVILFPQLRRTT